MAVSSTIGFKITGFFVLLLVLLILFFEIISIASLHNYYYDNVASVLYNQARYNADLFLSYLSNEDLQDIVVQNKNQFYRNNEAQVQILDNTGRVLFDNLGTVQVGEVLDSPDVIAVQNKKKEAYIGTAPYDDEPVMSISQPLNSQSRQVGMIRLTTTLRNVNSLIQMRSILYIGFGALIIALTIFVSWLVSRSLTRPIKALTRVANRLADGQFQVRAEEDMAGEIGELARTMNFMGDSILKKEQLKNEFISSVSHELRTPLTSIKGWAITLQGADVPQELNQEGLKIIEKEADRLGVMVEDLLDFSRFSSGKITLTKSTFDAVETAKNIYSQFRPRTREKNLDMVLNYVEDQVWITADEDRIKQVLLNLIDNAIKFTPEGGTIFTNIERTDEHVLLSVTDTGVGISEHDIALATEKFWKGSSSASHTGLGLSICEEIAKLHGGQLVIKSKLGVGTTVTMLFPQETV